MRRGFCTIVLHIVTVLMLMCTVEPLLANADTLGTAENVLISEVSAFQV